jgi:hypothetical protein
MKRMTLAMALALATLPGLLQAQSAPEQNTPAQTTVETRSLRDQLMPAGTAAAVQAPAVANEKSEFEPNQPVMARGSGVGYMIAGAALFIGGLLIGGDAGTAVAVAGAAVGAYGLYIHFQ